MNAWATYLAASGTAAARPVTGIFFGTAEDRDAQVVDSGEAKAPLTTYAMPDDDALTALQRRVWTVNEATGAIAAGVATRRVGPRQAEALARAAGLVADVDWTQRLDARITAASSAAFRARIDALRGLASHASWATDPEAALAAVEAAVPEPAPVAASTPQGEVLERAHPAANAIVNSDFIEGAAEGMAEIFNAPATSANWSRVVRPAGTLAGGDYPVLEMAQTGAASAGSIDTVFTQADATGSLGWTAAGRRLLPCKALDWLGYSFKGKTVSCATTVLIGFTDKDGTIVGAYLTLQNAISLIGGDTTNPETWDPSFEKVQVPDTASIAYAFIRHRKHSHPSGTSSQLLIHDPMFGHVHERQLKPSPWMPSSPRYLGPRFRAGAVLGPAILKGAIGPDLRVDANGPFTHINAAYLSGSARASLDIGAVARGEAWFCTWSFRARKQASADPNLYAQYRFQDPDTGTFTAWRNAASWIPADLTTSYETFAAWAILPHPTADLELAVWQHGAGTGTTAQVLKDITISAKRIDK